MKSVWSLLFIMLACAVAKHSGQSIISTDRREAMRSFVFLTIRGKGVLMMIADKNAKGVHYQLPGGRIDEIDFRNLNVTTNTHELSLPDLVHVAKHAACREIREETGYEVENPEALEYLGSISEKIAFHKKKGRGFMRGTQYPRKMFFKLDLDYDDFLKGAVVLSNEHIGYVLEPNSHKIENLIKKHSGGDPAEAVKLMHQLRITE